MPGLPRLPDKLPGYDEYIATDIAHQQCDKYLAELYRGGVGYIGVWFREPSPLRKGTVIATRYSGDFDLTHAPNNQKVDYLAQIVK